MDQLGRKGVKSQEIRLGRASAFSTLDHRGKVLRDEFTLLESSIENGSVVHVTSRLRGGGCAVSSQRNSDAQFISTENLRTPDSNKDSPSAVPGDEIAKRGTVIKTASIIQVSGNALSAFEPIGRPPDIAFRPNITSTVPSASPTPSTSSLPKSRSVSPIRGVIRPNPTVQVPPGIPTASPLPTARSAVDFDSTVDVLRVALLRRRIASLPLVTLLTSPASMGHLLENRSYSSSLKFPQDTEKDSITVTKSQYLANADELKAKHRRYVVTPDEAVVIGAATDRRPGLWFTVYIFVSSTFKDMHGERDHLTRVVFPELNERCRKYKVRVIPVDLRWGLRAEDTSESGIGALELCLTEVDRCRGWMIVLGGERYGWVPERYKISADPKWNWVRELGDKPTRSITAMEVYHGVLNQPDTPVHAFVYVRDPSFIENLDPQYLKLFIGEHQEKQHKFLEECRRHKYTKVTVNYSCAFDHVVVYEATAKPAMMAGRHGPDAANLNFNLLNGLGGGKSSNVLGGYVTDLNEWGNLVVSDIWEAVCREFPMTAAAETHTSDNDIYVEREFHKEIVDGVATIFGRDEELRMLEEFCTSPNKAVRIGLGHIVKTVPVSYMCLIGPSGIGKTSLLGNLCWNLQRQMEHLSPPLPMFLFSHFVGASGASIILRKTLVRLCRELRLEFGLTDIVPEQFDRLKRAVREVFLPKASAAALLQGKMIVLVVDGVNNFRSDGNLKLMDWIPDDMPANVRLIVSVKDHGPVLQSMLIRRNTPYQMRLGPLNQKSRVRIINDKLNVYRKYLDKEQQRLLLKKQAAELPLFLMVALEEIRVFGIYEAVTDFIKSMPDDLALLYGNFLKRLENDHGADLVQDALCLLVCSRTGLLEQELLEMLAAPKEVQLPRGKWARLYNSLDFSLRSSNGGGMLSFYYKQLERAVVVRYFQDLRVKILYHRTFAQYLLRRFTFVKGPNLRNPHNFAVWRRVVQACRKFAANASRTMPSLDRLKFHLTKEFSPRALEMIPFQLLKGRMWEDLETVLTNMKFIQAKCAAGMTYDLISDYMAFMEAIRKHADDTLPRTSSENILEDDLLELGELSNVPSDMAMTRVKHFFRFVRKNGYLLSQEPSLLFQLAYNEADFTAPAIAARARAIVGADTAPWLEYINKPQDSDHVILTLKGHDSFVWALCCSPDGNYIISACWDSTVQVWNVLTGMQVAVLEGHKSNVRCCSYSPDGHFAVSGGADFSLKVWDMMTYGAAWEISRAHDDVIWAVAWSPDGQYIVSGSEDRTCKVFRVSDRSEVKQLKSHNDWVRAVAFAPSGQLLASASDDETIAIWQTTSWVLVTTLTGIHSSVIRSVAFSPDSRYLASASGDRTVRMWSTTSWAAVKTFRGHSALVHCVAFSPDGAFLCSSSLDRTVRIWDIDSKTDIYTLRGHSSNVRSCAFTPTAGGVGGDGTKYKICSASDDMRIKIWEVEAVRSNLTNNQIDDLDNENDEDDGRSPNENEDDRSFCIRTFTGHLSIVWSVCVSPDKKRLLSTCWDGSLKVWNLETGHEMPANLPNRKSACCSDWSVNGRYAATGGADALVKVWSTLNWTEVASLIGHDGEVWGVCFSPNSKVVVSCGEDMSVRLWSVGSWAQIATFPGHNAGVRCVSFSPITADDDDGGNFLLTASDDESVREWDANFIENETQLMGHRGMLRCAQYSPDASLVATCGGDKIVRIWDMKLASKPPILFLTGSKKIVNWVEFSPDGLYVCAACADTYIRIWELLTGSLVQVLKGHTKEVHQARFIDEKRLVTCSDDGTLKLWDWATAVSTENKFGPGLSIDAHGRRDSKTFFNLEARRLSSASSASPPPPELEGECLAVIRADPTEAPARSLAVYGDRIALGLWDGEIQMLHADSFGKITMAFQNGNNVRCVSFSPDGTLIASAGSDCTLQVWNVLEGCEQFNIANAHDDVIWDVQFSSDGKLIATTSADRTIKLWSLIDRKEVELLRVHTDTVRSCAWSPDGRFLLSASEDETICVWDTRTWAASSETVITQHNGAVLSVAFAPDSSAFASASTDRTVRIFSTRTWAQLRGLRGHTSAVNCVAFSRSGLYLASCSLDGTIRIWEFKTGTTLAVMHGHIANVHACRFVSLPIKGKDNQTRLMIVSTADDRSLRLWSFGKALKKVLDERAAAGLSLKDNDTKTLSGDVATNSDDSIALGLGFSKRLQSLSTLTSNARPVWACAASPDGKWILSGSWSGLVKVFKASTGEEIPTDMSHPLSVRGCAFSNATEKYPAGRWAATASGDYSVKIWDTNTWKMVTQLRDHTDVVWGCVFSPNGLFLCTAGEDRTVRVWSTATWQELRAPLKGHDDWVRSVDISHDSAFIVSGSDDETVRLWDAQSGQEIASLYGHTGGVRTVAFSPDGLYMASGSIDKTVRIWECQSGREVGRLDGHRKTVTTVKYDPSGSLILSGSADGDVKVWDAHTLRPLESFRGHYRDVHCVCFVPPDADRCVSASEDCTLKIWDLRSLKQSVPRPPPPTNGGKLLPNELDMTGALRATDNNRIYKRPHTGGDPLAHKGIVYGVLFPNSGNFLVSCAQDRTIKVWSLSEGDVLRTKIGHGGAVRSLSFSRDDCLMATSSWDRTIKIWKVDTYMFGAMATIPAHGSIINSCSLAPDGLNVASAGEDRLLKVWSIRQGLERWSAEPHEASVQTCQYSPDGSFLASGGADATVKIWSAKSLEPVVTLRGHTETVKGIRWSRDGSLLLSYGDDGSVRLWDPRTWKQRNVISSDGRDVRGACFFQGEKYIAATMDDKSMRVIDIRSDTSVGKFFGASTLMSVASWGGYIATGGADGQVCILRQHNF
eukprot:CAMPEP_0184652704 /NCGR_PEP_ID=MMETSP0308-20130426/10405_1 /TAXON_ID=38269 /ORGANISM="Gloeochaete witrockiana, Strain SAG 46.84" /LENGTH=2826 /DNA_ID=CAMNT_0027087733 /DNA_START=120 /DNA_END=8601 /DNA_ORIENTATION=+